MPSHATYIVAQAAQDHAMPGAAFVRARKTRRYDRAMCVQRSQGGLVRKEKHAMAILPLPLRRPALKMRKQGKYDRLWGSIEKFNHAAGTGGGGEVVGVERAPSHAYWAAVWEPLIRSCHGAYAILAERQGSGVPATRTPLDARGARTLDDVDLALEEADRLEDEYARRKVRDLLDEPFERVSEEMVSGLGLETVSNDQLTGQVVRAEERVLYASLIANCDVSRPRGWRFTRPFQI